MSKPVHFYVSELNYGSPATRSRISQRRQKKKIIRTEFATVFVEPSKPDSRSNLKTILDEFLDSSSIHGVGHLARKDHHCAEYVVWLAMISAAVVGTSYLGHIAWRRYQYFPTVVSMEKDYKNWNTTFAMASICPEFKIDVAKLNEIAGRYRARNAADFVDFFRSLAASGYDNFDLLPEYDEVTPDHYLRIVIEARYNFSFKLSNSQDIDQELLLMVTENGLCYGINSDIGIYFSVENINRPLPIRRNINLIEGSPLDGEVFIQVMNISSGYSMTLTGPYDLPDVATRRFSSEHHRYLLLDLTALPIVSSEKVRSLAPKQRKCRYPDESNLDISDVYSYNLCRMQCRADLAYKLCGCIPYFYKKSDRKTYCNAAGLKCLGTHGRSLSDLRDPRNNEKVQCGCLPLCHDVHYMIELETHLNWPAATNLKFSMVRYPRTRLKREVIFGFADLLVSIGGAVGLFLGCSVLGLTEIVYFLTLRLFFLLKGNAKLRGRIGHGAF